MHLPYYTYTLQSDCRVGLEMDVLRCTLQDLLLLDPGNGRTSKVGDNEALILLTGLFVGRAFVTSVSPKEPVSSLC